MMGLKEPKFGETPRPPPRLRKILLGLFWLAKLTQLLQKGIYMRGYFKKPGQNLCDL